MYQCGAGDVIIPPKICMEFGYIEARNDCPKAAALSQVQKQCEAGNTIRNRGGSMRFTILP